MTLSIPVHVDATMDQGGIKIYAYTDSGDITDNLFIMYYTLIDDLIEAHIIPHTNKVPDLEYHELSKMSEDLTKAAEYFRNNLVSLERI
jgi:hypothetical protein